METHGYLSDIHTKKWRCACATFTQKKGEDAQVICVTFTQRTLGQLHSEKKAKRCGSPHKMRVMYEIKGNKEVYS